MARLAVVLLAALLAAGGSSARAQGPGPGAAGPTPAADDRLGQATPRGAVHGFLAAHSAGEDVHAARYLARGGSPAGRADERPRLARQLGTVLDQAATLDLEALSSQPAGERDDGLAPSLEKVATVATATGPVAILLQRLTAADGGRVWKFAPATVARIPALHAELARNPLAELLPAPLVEVRVLEVALWQWIALLVLLVGATAASWLAAVAVVRVLGPLVRRSSTTVDERLLATTIGPVRLVAGVLVFSVSALTLGLPAPVRQLLAHAEKAATIIAVTWLLLRVVDVFADTAAAGLAARGRGAAVAMVPVGRKAAKAVLLGFALLAVLQNVGVNITGILAGLGIGGLAVALAAQKTVENLFGGLTLMVDQPVRVGDFCRFGDRLGVVEDVGLRSTRVRTLERTVVTVPNAEFSALHLENFTRRDRIWLHVTLGLRYETAPDQLRHVLVEIRKLLYAHPWVQPDPARIRFVGFGAYSLDLEIFAYVQTTDYGEFLAIREDIYLRILDIVAASGTGFAFPSQTTYIARDTGLNRARGQAAEEEVRRWRAGGALPLPEFPPEAIAALRGTVPYPPEGAARPTAPARCP